MSKRRAMFGGWLDELVYVTVWVCSLVVLTTAATTLKTFTEGHPRPPTSAMGQPPASEVNWAAYPNDRGNPCATEATPASVL